MEKEEDEEGLMNNETVKLLGLPSYEYLLKSDKLERNEEMVTLEQNIKAYYRSKNLTSPERLKPPQSAKTEMMMLPNSSRENISGSQLQKEEDM